MQLILVNGPMKENEIMITAPLAAMLTIDCVPQSFVDRLEHQSMEYWLRFLLMKMRIHIGSGLPGATSGHPDKTVQSLCP